MYYLENGVRYEKHNFLPMVGITTDMITDDIYHKQPLILIDSYNYNDTKQRRMYADIIEKRRSMHLPTKILYEFSYETGIGDHEIVRYVNEIGVPKEDITFLLHNAAKEFIKESLNKYRFYFIDHFALALYSKYRSGEIKAARKPLIERRIGINILVAQLHWKKTRLHTLYHLYRKGLLQSAITGILTLKENISSLEHEILDQSFWHWLYDHIGPADEVDVRRNHDSVISPGFPYSIDIYNNTRVSHICETLCTEMNGPACFLTEKTYRPILNMSPFVLQGSKGHLEYLQSKGFGVFDKYINIDYDKSTFQFSDIPKTVDATRELLIATIDHANEIETITQHNFRRLLDIGKQEYNNLQKFLGIK